jgi:hypothetical protein
MAARGDDDLWLCELLARLEPWMPVFSGTIAASGWPAARQAIDFTKPGGEYAALRPADADHYLVVAAISTHAQTWGDGGEVDLVRSTDHPVTAEWWRSVLAKYPDEPIVLSEFWASLPKVCRDPDYPRQVADLIERDQSLDALRAGVRR